MGKPTICICENKGADQLRGNREADQRLCFRYSNSTFPPLLNSKFSSFYLFSVLVQVDLCQTCSETTLLVFPRGGSLVNTWLCLNMTEKLTIERHKPQFTNIRKPTHMSRLVGKPTMWFSNRSDTNRPVQSQKQARRLKFWSQVEEELYYPSSENKGADQLRGYREADLRLCFPLCRLLVFPRGGSYFNLQLFQTHFMNHVSL